MDYCTVLARSIYYYLTGYSNELGNIIIGDRTNGELGFDIIISKPQQKLWQNIMEDSKLSELSKKVLSQSIKLHQSEDPSNISIIPTQNFFLYDRLRFYQIMRGNKNLPFNENAAIIPIGRTYPLDINEIRSQSNVITRFLFTLIDINDFS